MPSLKAIRKRITSVKNTRKITRAMKLVSTAKLRRAQEALIAARPYTQAIAKVVSELAGVAGTGSHPLFAERPPKRIGLVVITSDRGQAGAFNANVAKAVERYVRDELPEGAQVSLRIIGRKGNQYFSRRRIPIASAEGAPTGAQALALAGELANRLIAEFEAEQVDRAYLVYNEFRSAISQVVRTKQILPVVPEPVPATSGAKADDFSPDFTYEPSKEVLLARLVPLYVQIQLYGAFLESIAAELAARMTAMENATKNAGEMIARLTLSYNRARQAAITKELLEIIGGAEALKG
jgi:F-type H+-transporting ATPase subunit gamma